MIQILQNLRDFMDEYTKKHLPGNLLVHNCILLIENKTLKDGIFGYTIQVFDEKGTHIGEITNPAFIPKSRF